MEHSSNSLMEKIRIYSIPLILGVIVAVVWANVHWDSYYHFVHFKIIGSIDFHFLINDIFMVFFFAIAAIEITLSLLPGGSLNPMKKAVNPLFATIGGVLGPIAVFFLLNILLGAPEFARGWGIPTATDIALAWLLARLIFGTSHPAVSFLLLLAIADDAIGLGIIAIFYPNPELPAQPIWLLSTLAGMMVAYMMRRFDIRSFVPYLVIGGLLSWFGLLNAGLHPALSLVVIMPFLPHDENLHGNNPEDQVYTYKIEHSTLVDFEVRFRPFVDFGLFFFGLSNAGVQFASMSAVTWIVLFSLLIGKTVGIYGFGRLAELIGFPLPDGMNRGHLLTAGLIAGLGLTVALFVAGVAFVDPAIQGAAKMGALFSAVVFVLAPLFARFMGVKKEEEQVHQRRVDTE